MLFYSEADYNEHHYGGGYEFQNEFQAAYAVSQMEPATKVDRQELEKLSSFGFYVVVMELPRYCRHTDAILSGSNEYIELVTRAKAEVDQFEENFRQYDCEGYRIIPPERT